jgi:hypothetical protein
MSFGGNNVLGMEEGKKKTEIEEKKTESKSFKIKCSRFKH